MPNDTESENMILPPELILHTIGYLDPDSDEDRAALARCAQTSSMFRHDAQKQLFSSVTIPYDIIGNARYAGYRNIRTVDTCKSQQFFQAISLSPILATFVRRLYIPVDFQSLDDTDVGPKTQTSFAALLSLMKDLEEFTWYQIPEMLTWEAFNKQTQNSIQSLIKKNRHLRKLDMRDTLMIPPLLICSSPKLQTLAIGDLLENFDPSENPHIQPPNTSQLTTLVSHNMRFLRAIRPLLRFLRHPSCPISLSELELFDVKSQVHENHSEMQTIVDMCKDTLTRFFWDTAGENVLLPDHEPVVDLSKLSQLSELRLIGRISGQCYSNNEGQVIYEDELRTCPLNYFSNLLLTLPCSRSTDGSFKLSVNIRIYLSNLSIKNVQDIAWGVFVDAIKDAGRKSWNVSVSLMSFMDGNGPSTAEKKLAKLKENIHLKELGESLVFI